MERKEAQAAEQSKRRKSKVGISKQESFVSLPEGEAPPELKEQELKSLANVTFDEKGKQLSVKHINAGSMATTRREMEPNNNFKLSSLLTSTRPKLVDLELTAKSDGGIVQKVAEHLTKVVAGEAVVPDDKQDKPEELSHPEQISPVRGVTVKDGTGRVLSLGKDYGQSDGQTQGQLQMNLTMYRTQHA